MFLKIKEKIKKIKSLENDILLVLVIVFVALSAFGLGRLSVFSERKTPITIESLSAAVVQPAYEAGFVEKLYVASKNGTKYHYPWCAGAQSIKEGNKVWFATKEEAEKAGYGPAANCKGL